MSNKDIKTLLNKLAGVYRDASRISRDASALLRCPLGQNLQPSISVLSLNDGSYYPSVLVFQGKAIGYNRVETFSPSQTCRIIINFHM